MLWRALILAAVFLCVGWLTSHAVITHSPARTADYKAQIRLAGEMAGLFAGGTATALVGVGMVVIHTRRK